MIVCIQILSTNVDDGLIFLQRTQDIQTAELPFSTVGGEYRRGADASMYRSSFLVDEGACFLQKIASAGGYNVRYG